MIISAKARLAGVLGWPISHSRSPRLHGFWLDQLQIDGAYLPLAVSPQDLAHVVKALPRMGFAGVNVTVPHKQAVMALCDHVDDLAARIGAVNTLTFQDDGRIFGQNTDAFGFMENLRQGAPGFDFAAGPAVVLGAGGAARAVVAALLDQGVSQIKVVNRSLDRAAALAQDMNTQIGGQAVTAHDWAALDQALHHAHMLVNTTSLGMQGQPPLCIDLSPLPRSALVTDIVYAPLQTQLLQQAAQRGHVTVDGIGMLLWQAVPGFQAWFGVRPAVTPSLRDFVLS